MGEELIQAVKSLSCNRRRSFLTVSMMAVGVMSIVGIETAVDILAERVAGSFSRMGSDLLTIAPEEGGAPLSFGEAAAFAREFQHAEAVSVSALLSPSAVVKCGTHSTDPVVALVATDGNCLKCRGALLLCGRFLAEEDVAGRRHVAVIGDNVRRRLFGEGTGLGCMIDAAGGRYEVIGCIERQGAVFGTGLDGSVLVPAFRGGDYSVTLVPRNGEETGAAAASAELLMRRIRRLAPSEKNDFEIVRADSARAIVAGLRRKLSAAALAAGLITLLGAAVGLMNILLVSVKERTREIGTRRALGARASDIRREILAESAVLGQAGALAGTVLGVLAGNLVAAALDGSFTVPWRWIIISAAVCGAVSLLSALLPAGRAAAMDPVEALRTG